MTPAEELTAAANRIREVANRRREQATEATRVQPLFDWSACLLIADLLDGISEEYVDLSDGIYGPAAQGFVAGDSGGDPDPAILLARHILGRTT